jgi:hypothetical protein
MATKKEGNSVDKKVQNRLAEIAKLKKSKATIVKFKVGEKEFKFKVNRSVDLASADHIVTRVVENSFVDGVYCPAYVDLAFKRAIVGMFTDCDIDEELSDFDTIYYIFNETNLYEMITDCISETQFEELKDAVINGVEYKKEQMLKNSEFEGFMLDLRDLAMTGLTKLSELDFSKMDFSKIGETLEGLAPEVQEYAKIKNKKAKNITQ